MGNGARECGWRHAPEARREFSGFWKSQLVEFCLGRRRLAFACSPNMYLSLYVEEPLNSKVIKSFVPEVRSRKCFCVSGFLCSMYICYEHSMYVSHIAVSGYHHHHHHIVLAARISLTLSRHSSLSFIALGRSSGQHPVSSHSCWMYVRAGRPAFARPCVGIHKSTSLMSSSLLLQRCPACLVRLTWIVFVIGGRWPYSWCLVGCCCQDLTLIWRQNHWKPCTHFTLINRKARFIVGYTNFSKQPHQGGRKSQIWQEVDCKMSRQYGCSGRFCRKKFENVPSKTFPRTWSFTRTVG